MKTVLTWLRFTLVLLILCSCLYPNVVWCVGRVVFPHQAEGSLLRRADGRVIGSELIGQEFSSARYFHGRPSAVGWNAARSGGSNLSPTNPDLVDRIATSVALASELDGLSTATVAADRVFASASGLDPDVTPENALQQAPRVAKATGLAEHDVRALVIRMLEPRLGGLLGTPRANVLKLNLALDSATAVSRVRGERGGHDCERRTPASP